MNDEQAEKIDEAWDKACGCGCIEIIILSVVLAIIALFLIQDQMWSIIPQRRF